MSPLEVPTYASVFIECITWGWKNSEASLPWEGVVLAFVADVSRDAVIARSHTITLRNQNANFCRGVDCVLAFCFRRWQLEHAVIALAFLVEVEGDAF